MWVSNLFFIISLIFAIFIFCKIRKSILQDVSEIKEYLKYIRSNCPYEMDSIENFTPQNKEKEEVVVQKKGDKNG